MRNQLLAVAAGLSILAFAGSARAGTYATITIDGSFSDWDNVPVASTQSANTGTPIDFASLKIANDSNYVYFDLKFNTPVNPQSGSGVFIAVDSDNNVGTGYNIFGRNEVGANFGFQNDFPFTQSATNFNTGGQTSDTLYLASPYDTDGTAEQEIAVPIDASQVDTSDGGYTGPIFPSTFTVEFYSVDGEGDTLGPVEYTLAVAPEPTSVALLALAGLPMLRHKRRKSTSR